jgi:Fe-S cluster biogenesis protein NfuA
MVGACYACPLSMATLRAGIEQRLRQVAPEVQSVVAI